MSSNPSSLSLSLKDEINHIDMIRQVLDYVEEKNIYNMNSLVNAYNAILENDEADVNPSILQGLRYWLNICLKYINGTSNQEVTVKDYKILTMVNDNYV